MRTLVALLAITLPAAAGIEWEKDLASARTRAEYEGKLLFVDIFSPT